MRTNMLNEIKKDYADYWLACGAVSEDDLTSTEHISMLCDILYGKEVK